MLYTTVTDVRRIEAMQAQAKGAKPEVESSDESEADEEEGGTFVFEDTKTF